MSTFIRVIRWYLLLISALLPGVKTRVRLGPLGLYEEEDIVSAEFPSTRHVQTLYTSTLSPAANSTSWAIFKDNFLPLFFFFTSIISTSYFLHRLIRKFNLHFKYRRFKFVRRSAAETADIKLRNTIIEMDPLRIRGTIDLERYYDARETIV